MIFSAASCLAVGLPDDLQDLVERVEDGLEAFEDVDARLQRFELVLEPGAHDLEPEVQELPEDLVQLEPLGLADERVLGRHQARQVDREVRLERRVLVEIRHHHPLVGVALELQRDPHVVGRQVLDVEQVRQLARERDVGDALDERRLVHGVRHAGDVDRLAAARGRPFLPGGADADGAACRSCRCRGSPAACS